MDQPPTRRLNTSRTTATDRTPSPVETSVRSATQSRSGDAAVTVRPTTSGAELAAGSRRVVLTACRRWPPTKPAWRLSRATRVRPQPLPVATSAARMRGAP